MRIPQAWVSFYYAVILSEVTIECGYIEVVGLGDVKLDVTRLELAYLERGLISVRLSSDG